MTPEEIVFDLARQAGLLFNEDKGTEMAQAMHKERLLKFAKLIVQGVLEDLSRGGS